MASISRPAAGPSGKGEGSSTLRGAAARPIDPVAGVLSYLVPGLGQIVQGRVGKGLLFLVCIYALFFYGLYLGRGQVTIGKRTYRISSNVYLPDTVEEDSRDSKLGALAQNLYNRPQFAGQFWVGIAAWPAVWQYLTYDRASAARRQAEIDRLHDQADLLDRDNDSTAAEEKRAEARALERQAGHPYLADFMREPSASAINAVHNASDKRLELAWVYTVIAGVLNIMVIYDAVAGPAFTDPRKDPENKPA